MSFLFVFFKISFLVNFERFNIKFLSAKDLRINLIPSVFTFIKVFEKRD